MTTTLVAPRPVAEPTRVEIPAGFEPADVGNSATGAAAPVISTVAPAAAGATTAPAPLPATASDWQGPELLPATPPFGAGAVGIMVSADAALAGATPAASGAPAPLAAPATRPSMMSRLWAVVTRSPAPAPTVTTAPAAQAPAPRRPSLIRRAIRATVRIWIATMITAALLTGAIMAQRAIYAQDRAQIVSHLERVTAQWVATKAELAAERAKPWWRRLNRWW